MNMTNPIKKRKMLKKYTLFIGIVSFLPNFAPDFECLAW